MMVTSPRAYLATCLWRPTQIHIGRTSDTLRKQSSSVRCSSYIVSIFLIRKKSLSEMAKSAMKSI